MLQLESGWPARSLHGNVSGYRRSRDQWQFVRRECLVADEAALVKWTYGWNEQIPTFGMLAYSPLWPGFAINTIFYAAMLYALFAVPGAGRRRLRNKRGQCASCGYSLRGRGAVSDRCPECGAA